MKVKELMTTGLRTCAPEDNVAKAGCLMWEGDCGILPVVEAQRLIGVVTDRDIAIALATQNKRAAELSVGTVLTRYVSTCSPDDDVSAALALMNKARVRRLPVVGAGGGVLGILSLSDIVQAAGRGQPVKSDEVIETLQTICARRQPAPNIVAV